MCVHCESSSAHPHVAEGGSLFLSSDEQRLVKIAPGFGGSGFTLVFFEHGRHRGLADIDDLLTARMVAGMYVHGVDRAESHPAAHRLAA